MARDKASTKQVRSGFTLVELVIVVIMLGVIAAMAIPKLNMSQYRADGGAQQVRSVFQTAQRTSLTRQYDVIVSMDTVAGTLQIAEDVNNDGIIQSTEWKFKRSLGEGNTFAMPPKGVNGTVAASVVGATLKTINGLPSVIFHRDGTSNSNTEIYLQSNYKGRVDFRAVTLTRATGRAELYRMAGTGSAATWQVVQ
jgi:prepilin-type N-terminal cleavage/methylation domain-containing protein